MAMALFIKLRVVPSAVVLSVITAVGASIAKADAPPATGRNTTAAFSHTDMMGAPGLVPLNIMTGQARHWMVSYQFMFEQMDGNLVGTDNISSGRILQSFAFSPTSMTMQMHMLMVMYAATDQLNFTIMVPYSRKDMDMLARDGSRFTEHSDGIGDVQSWATYTVYQIKDLRHRLLLKGGLGLPTGSIDATMDGVPLEYPMQLGSGTVSLLPGFTYLGQALPWGWGFDFSSTVQLGTNDHHYRFGNRYEPSVWIARQLTDWVSVSVTANGEIWENVHGADPRLALSDQPTNDPDRQGGKRLDASVGINLHPRHGFFRGQQFLVEGRVPVVQSLDGPQLQRSWLLRFGWQYDF
jgi:hypothetical protein